MPLQRESLPIPVAVFNFQTETGNYIADGVLVHNCDLHARHLWLIGQRERLTERLMGNPDFFDAKAAGWWAWGLSCWIGSGWCSGTGPWTVEDGEIVLGNPGQGVSRKRPHLGNPGQGVNRKRPHLGNHGRGVNRKLPHLGDPGRERLAWLTEEIGRFSRRLRDVRVCCGDWSRVCGPAVTHGHGLTGVFLDPPYGEGRTAGLYSTDTMDISAAVRNWAVEQGDSPLMRIVLAGYEGDYEMPGTWTAFEWQATGGYGLIGDDEDAGGRANRRRERLWLSPHCVRERSLDLFAALDEAAS